MNQVSQAGTEYAVNDARLVQFMADILQPPSGILTDHWADQHRELPPGSPRGGQWVTSEAPYTRAVMRAAHKRGLRRVVWIFRTQSGKSALGMNIAGCRLDEEPRPTMIVAPTEKQAAGVFHKRLDSMLRHCSRLWGRTVQGQSYTALSKIVSGVPIRLAWAGSAAELQSDTAGLMWADETDEMPWSIPGEGALEDVLDQRTAAYDEDGLSLYSSTPTDGMVEPERDEHGIDRWAVGRAGKVRSKIWRLWEMGSRHEWAWPCPDCETYYVPRRSLLCEHGLTCPHCGSVSDDKSKSSMNGRGVYLCPGQTAEIGSETHAYLTDHVLDDIFEIEHGDSHIRDDERSASFWASGLSSFSSRASFRNLWLDCEEAKGDSEKERALTNKGFAELFAASTITPDADAYRRHCVRDYGRGEVPEGVILPIMTVDCQVDHLVWTIRGWGHQRESWLLEWGTIEGDPEDAKTFREVERIAEANKVRYIGVDSGYSTEDVYDWCRKRRVTRFAMKGRNQQRIIMRSDGDSSGQGKAKKYGLSIWLFASDRCKQFVHSRTRAVKSGPGAWHLPRDIDDEYLEQLVAEEMDVASGKYIDRGKHDYLDCEAMSMALAVKFAALLKRVPRETTPAEKAIEQPVRQRTTRRRGGWASG